jgi:hypothetical protein
MSIHDLLKMRIESHHAPEEKHTKVELVVVHAVRGYPAEGGMILEI